MTPRKRRHFSCPAGVGKECPVTGPVAAVASNPVPVFGVDGAEAGGYPVAAFSYFYGAKEKPWLKNCNI